MPSFSVGVLVGLIGGLCIGFLLMLMANKGNTHVCRCKHGIDPRDTLQDGNERPKDESPVLRHMVG